jgi:site-specific DNA-methyltransferase (adenine-specific)
VKIELVSIDDLTLDPANARKHDEKNLKAIAESLKQFGQRKPIVVWGSTVVAGNGTLVAARSLGWTEITVAKIPDDWSSNQVTAYALADNRSAELAVWDEQVLASQLVELQQAEFDIELLGFELPVDELAEVIEDEIPEQIEPKAKLGDVWKLGRHRLMCGDSTSVTDVDLLTLNEKCDMAFTDPPYGVAYTGGIQFTGKNTGEAVFNNREMIQNDDVDLYEDVIKMLSLKVNGACYIWFSDSNLLSLYSAAKKFGDVHALILWVKNGGYSAMNANYKQKHEPCLYWKPKNTTLKFIGDTTETTIWEINKDGKNKHHPTQKPVELAYKAITNHDAKSVLDLFGGSGSTLIACEQTDRVCFMMELDPKYVDVIITRWEKLTGQTAELIEG